MFLKIDEGQTLGGLAGEICWNWMEIHYLVIDEQVRKLGYGKKLLLEAEKLAKEKECDIIKLDTFPLYGERRYTSNSYQQRTTLHMRRLPNPWYWGLSGTPRQTPSACPSMPCTSSPLDKINSR
ncbi:GNAT family N-acetyltransferase [Paenibacillus thiaminolyticus]|uniref:GNAT family N-acetyltransferase n=1 Tax=Paenibacillus thiaminolyticus TaxID=49283 RepID=A0AAP9DT99_PANTH|nr:GNAT family N-acetyltransferase [Paenibacillus thiaminolyticus]